MQVCANDGCNDAADSSMYHQCCAHLTFCCENCMCEHMMEFQCKSCEEYVDQPYFQCSYCNATLCPDCAATHDEDLYACTECAQEHGWGLCEWCNSDISCMDDAVVKCQMCSTDIPRCEYCTNVKLNCWKCEHVRRRINNFDLNK